MKRAIILTTAFLIVAVLSVAAQSKNKNTEQDFLRLHRAEEEAESKKDVAALDRLLNDDFIFVAANGSVSEKKKFLDEIKGDSEPSPAPQPNLSYEDFKARVYGKTAIVNYILLVSGKDKDGKDYANRYRMSVVWIKQKGNWRISNFHSTRVRA